MLVVLNRLRVLQIGLDLLHDVGGVLVRAALLRDSLRVVGLEQLQRNVLAIRDGHRIRLRAIRLRIESAWQKLIVSIHLFQHALRLVC